MTRKALARAVNGVLGRAGLRLSRTGTAPEDAGADAQAPAYPIAAQALASAGGPLRVAIVGANDGRTNDPIHATLTGPLRECTEVLLIEPQPSLIPHLAAAYAGHPRHHIAKAAVGPGGPLTLHAIRSELFPRIHPPYARDWPIWRAPTGVTSANRQHVIDWLRWVDTDDIDPEAAVEELQVETAPLTDLLRAAGMAERIDILQIDTEGLDDQIVYASAIEITQPRLIHFESKLLPPDRAAALEAHLRPAYALHPNGDDTLAIRLP